MQKRIGDKLKSTVDDIVHMWTVIDEKSALATLSIFCSGDTGRTATIPDELTDLAYRRTVVTYLRKQVQDLTGLVTQLSNQQEKPC